MEAKHEKFWLVDVLDSFNLVFVLDHNFSTSALFTFGAGSFSAVGTALRIVECPAAPLVSTHRSISVPPQTVPTKDVSKHCKMSPGAKSTLVVYM